MTSHQQYQVDDFINTVLVFFSLVGSGADRPVATRGTVTSSAPDVTSDNAIVKGKKQIYT